jgi:hypothetical protein
VQAHSVRPLPAFDRIYLIFLFRQPGSFGRNQAKQWWAVRLQGIANFAEAVTARTKVGQRFAAPVLADLRGKGLCGKDFYDQKQIIMLQF